MLDAFTKNYYTPTALEDIRAIYSVTKVTPWKLPLEPL
jgi:hypothetical protein